MNTWGLGPTLGSSPPFQPSFSGARTLGRMTTHLTKNPPGRLARTVGLVVLASVLSALSPPAPASAGPSSPTTLTAKAGTAEALFGTSVSIDGNTAVAGAPDERGVGAAYVFTKRAGRWVEQATLIPPARIEGEKFGYDVAISGDTIVVGAPSAEQSRPVAPAGVAYVFVRTPHGWSHQAKLVPSDSKADDAFGFGVAISGDTVLVGANGGSVLPSVEPGAAYVFTRGAGTWSEQAKLTPAGGAADDNFGYSVALSGDTALVGAYTDNVGAGVDQGSARVFTRTGTTWTEQATLSAADGMPGDAFGESTSVFGDTIAVGASGAQVGLNPGQGAAYVYTRDGQGWKQVAKLTAPDGTSSDMFGRSVTTTEEHVAVGAHFDEGGSVYVFRRVNSGWEAPTKLRAEGAGLLGVSLWMSGRTVIAGANFTAVNGNANQGAAYVFEA